MKELNFEKVLRAIVIATAMAEAVCGKKFMKRIGKRLKALNKMAEIEVWLGVYNRINPSKSVSIENSAFANSPIVAKESRYILEKILSKAKPNDDNREERMKNIIASKFEKIFNESKH